MVDVDYFKSVIEEAKKKRSSKPIEKKEKLEDKAFAKPKKKKQIKPKKQIFESKPLIDAETVSKQKIETKKIKFIKQKPEPLPELKSTNKQNEIPKPIISDLSMGTVSEEERKSDAAEQKAIEIVSKKIPEERIKQTITNTEKKIVEKAKQIFIKKQENVKSLIEEKVKKTKKEVLEEYGKVKIFKLKDEALPIYFTPSPRATGADKTIVNTIKEAATRLITISPYKIRDPEQRRSVYKQRILDILNAAPELRIPKNKFEFYADAVIREMVGYGLIDSLVRDDQLEEIMVIGAKSPVYVFHRKYEMMKTNIEFYSNDEINDLINRIGREVGRRIDISNPLLDARLADGSRVNATINPASVSGSTLTIRKFKKDPYSIIDLIKMNTLSAEAAAFLWLCAEGLGTKPANILIAGGTGSGKTTMLNVLSSFIPESERIITIEDTAELNLPLDHWIRLEAKPPGLEGKGELTMDILTKNSLRMRPDRVIVGEIRHDEAFTLFTAMNTGHDGSFGTVHANSSKETIIRVTNPPMNVPMTMLSGLDFIIVEQRIHDKKLGTIRRLTEISEMTGVLEGHPDTQIIFERNAQNDSIERTGMPSSFLKKLAVLSGNTMHAIEEELERREKFLEELVRKDIHDMKTVSKKMLEFTGE